MTAALESVDPKTVRKFLYHIIRVNRGEEEPEAPPERYPQQVLHEREPDHYTDDRLQILEEKVALLRQELDVLMEVSEQTLGQAADPISREHREVQHQLKKIDVIHSLLEKRGVSKHDLAKLKRRIEKAKNRLRDHGS